MNLKLKSRVPFLLCASVVLLAGLADDLTRRFDDFNLFRRIEWMTFDWRVRYAAARAPTNALSLGLVDISDDSIRKLQSGELGPKVGLYWPRWVYGQLVEELAHQGARAVAFDVLFAETRSDHAPVILPDGSTNNSDRFFADRLRLAGNVLLGARLPNQKLVQRRPAGVLAGPADERPVSGNQALAPAVEEGLYLVPKVIE